MKSSHRYEAIARGLGFRTYASLKAATADGGTIDVKVNGKASVAYLSEHSFEAQGHLG